MGNYKAVIWVSILVLGEIYLIAVFDVVDAHRFVDGEDQALDVLFGHTAGCDFGLHFMHHFGVRIWKLAVQLFDDFVEQELVAG
jgi:hypothetical protein